MTARKLPALKSILNAKMLIGLMAVLAALSVTTEATGRSLNGLAVGWASQPVPPSSSSVYFTETAKPPNILLLIADDVGVDKVGAYADDADPDYRSDAEFLPQTPTLDALAASGLRFTDAWANPKCSPTRAAIYTGNHGFRTGIGSPLGPPGQDELDPADVTTIAEVLADAGYSSAMVGKWHLGEGAAATIEWEMDTLTETVLHPLRHGWDSFSGTLTGELDTDGVSNYTDWERISSRGRHTITTNETTYATAQTVDDGLIWVKQQDEDTPWMLTMAFHAPHTPLEAPPEDCVWTEDEDLSDDREIYRAMMECLDINIADLLAGLDSLGHLDDTLIIFVGDNGTDSDLAEGVFADDRGKGTVHESGVRVPLIITDGRAWLQVQDNFVPDRDWMTGATMVANPGSDVDDLVHVVDLFATIAEVANADGSSGEDSISLLPVLRDFDSDLREFVYAEAFVPDHGLGELALRMEDWKLLAQVSEQDGALCRHNYRLYDLSTDRFEQSNLQADDADTLADMVALLDEIATEDAWFAVEECE